MAKYRLQEICSNDTKVDHISLRSRGVRFCGDCGVQLVEGHIFRSASDRGITSVLSLGKGSSPRLRIYLPFHIPGAP